MPLLADDDLGTAVDLFHLGLPIEIFLAARARFFVAQIIFLAEHEQHDVGILLDRARLTQVRKLWALVVAILDLPRKLGQRKDWNVELLGERLEARRDLGDLLHATFRGAPRRTLQELDIVDDQEVEPALALEAAGAGREL